MSAERITGAEAVDHFGGVNGPTWLNRLASQLDADADLAARLAAAERERDEWRRKYQNVDAAYSSVYGTEAELKALRAEKAEAALADNRRESTLALLGNAAGVPIGHTVADAVEYVAALRADAAEWRALQAVIGHPERDNAFGVYVGIQSVWCTAKGSAATIEVPTPTALLARLDALAEAAKPKPETWRWRFQDGSLSASVSTPEDLRHLGHSFDGTPVREVRNQDGDVLLLREGRPVPTEGGPWE